MLKIQQGVGALRASDDAQTRAWIAQTIRSVCIDEVRRRKRVPGFVALDETVPASTDRVVADAETRDRVEHLKNRAWAVLSARERQVLSLRFHEGLSFRQIAELLDVPQGSVTGWYSRALLRLREAIQ